MKGTLILSFLLVLGLLAFPVGSMANSNGDSQTFKVKVKTSFGTEFDDCYTFHNNGVLDIALLPEPQIWAYKGLGTSRARWQSTSQSGDFFVIAFSGLKWFLGLQGDGVSEEEATFKLKGHPDKNCSVAAAADAAVSSPYAQ